MFSRQAYHSRPFFLGERRILASRFIACSSLPRVDMCITEVLEICSKREVGRLVGFHHNNSRNLRKVVIPFFFSLLTLQFRCTFDCLQLVPREKSTCGCGCGLVPSDIGVVPSCGVEARSEMKIVGLRLWVLCCSVVWIWWRGDWGCWFGMVGSGWAWE